MLGTGLFKDLDMFEYVPRKSMIFDKTIHSHFFNIHSFFSKKYIISVSEKYASKVDSPIWLNFSKLIDNYTEVR
ncbi:hypothetical protein C5Z25_04410 [Lactobacillus sp. CBA3605]|nr:hypothetical protein C5Z25_04410 [Lactobacillus sp. CBA3605]